MDARSAASAGMLALGDLDDREPGLSQPVDGRMGGAQGQARGTRPLGNRDRLIQRTDQARHQTDQLAGK
jgi:hypothetical protein